VAPAIPAATDSRRIGSLTRLFGFAQFELAGTLAVPDGRYVIRDDTGEQVLVLETLGAPPPSRRRRRRPREADPASTPATLPLTRVTSVRAFEPFDGEEPANLWLAEAVASEESIDRVVADGIGVLNQALHAHAVASGDPSVQILNPQRAVMVRLGYGSGEEVAAGDYAAAREVDMRGGSSSPRRQRAEELRPQERLAAVLGGREQFDACETLLLRARADLNANRNREAALQLRVGLEALVAELPGTVSDPGHDDDMATLASRRHEAGTLANTALASDLDSTQLKTLHELLAICERILRRRRVLQG
jgi:BMFP domain-containing protein YqiC